MILLGGTAAFLLAHAPSWLIALLAIMLAADFSVFLIAFLYFMLKAPVSLRSETFGLKNLEMALRLFRPEKVAEIQRRELEMAAGRYEDLGDASELRTRKHKKIGSDGPSSPSEGQRRT